MLESKKEQKMCIQRAFFFTPQWTGLEKIGLNNNQLCYIIWYICRFPLHFFLLQFVRIHTKCRNESNKKKREKKTNKHSENEIVITRSVIFTAYSVAIWGDQIHWHVLIVCKLVKPFEWSIHGGKRREKKPAELNTVERSESRKSNLESGRKREKKYKLLNVEQICLSDREKARTQSKIT